MPIKKIIINGEVYCQNVTGIERVAQDTITALDALAQKGEIELVIPQNATYIPSLQNIVVVQLPYELHSFPRWHQFVFQHYVRQHHGISLGFANACPYFAPGIEYIHDIYCKLHEEDFTTRRDKIVRAYNKLMYRRIAKKAKKIIAVSDYTKQTLISTYGTQAEKIAVIYDGLSEGYTAIAPDLTVFDDFPQLRGKDFYFTLGSLSTRKNLKWIANHAERYPSEFFVISGNALANVVPPELEKLRTLKNICFVGYQSDARVKALFSACKAFIFPSYFEGFGLPPLEALSCGAKIIVSNATCLPEIYQDCAYYIHPDKPETNLDELLHTPVAPPDKLLARYTTKHAAEQLYAVIQSVLSDVA